MAKERNRQIEGLRGLSILIIMTFHLVYQFQIKYVDAAVLHSFPSLSSWGDFGVLIFIMISVWLQDSPRYDAMNGRSVIFHKLVRLWPTYAVCITITFVVTRFIELPDRTVNFISYIWNLCLVNGFINIPYVDGAHWYITMLISCVVWMTVIQKRFQRKTVAYITWVVLCAVIHYLPSPLNLLNRFTAFLYAGIIVFVVMLKKLLAVNDFSAIWKNQKLELAAILISLVYTFAMRSVGYIVLIVISAIVITFSMNQKLHFLNNRILIFVGQVSYPVYLVHQNLAYIIEYQLMQRMGSYYLWFAVIAFVCVFPIGIALYYLVEKPAGHFIKKKSAAAQ